MSPLHLTGYSGTDMIADPSASSQMVQNSMTPHGVLTLCTVKTPESSKLVLLTNTNEYTSLFISFPSEPMLIRSNFIHDSCNDEQTQMIS